MNENANANLISANIIGALIGKENKFKRGRGDDLSPDEKLELKEWIEKAEGNKKTYDRLTDISYLTGLCGLDVKGERKKVKASFNQHRYEISKKRLVDRIILRLRLFFNTIK